MTESQTRKAFVKHLLECNCILPQFKSHAASGKGVIPFHRFIVFSELRPDGSVKTSYAQCNNCSAIHKIVEVNKSEYLRREQMSSLPDIEELQDQVPEGMMVLLKKHDCPLPTWQQTEFIFRNKLWGEVIILSRERENPGDQTNPGKWITKYVLVLGDKLWKLYTDTEDDLESFYKSEEL
jgi:hypothetical protein